MDLRDLFRIIELRSTMARKLLREHLFQLFILMIRKLKFRKVK